MIARNSLLALAALAVFACTKEIEVSNIPESKEIQLTFTSKKPNFTDVGTRTEWDGSTITWSKGDAIRIAYTVNDVWQAANGAPESGSPAKMYASKGLSEAAEVAQFEVSAYFSDDNNTGLSSPVYKFYGVYPSAIAETDFKNPPIIPIMIPGVQTPTATSFDSSSDIMYATSEDYEGIPSKRVISLTWNRIVAHADISMTNLQLESEETVENITVTAQSGADLVGSHQLDITTGEVSIPTNGTAVNKVVVNATNLNVNSGAVEFWFSSLPFTATELTFTVKTNKYVYVRQFTGLNLSFKGNARNTLSVNMKRAQKFQDYTESFSSGQGEFTTSGDSGIWTAASYQSDNFMKGTSRINNTNTDGEGWLISPFLSILSNESEVSFSHAINGYFGDISNEATLWVRERGKEWTQIGITYPDKPDSGFTDFETTSASLSAYSGKTIQFGFKYVGSVSTGVGTWEVKDFKVTNAEAVYYPSFTFLGETTKQVAYTGATVEFAFEAAHLTSEPTVSVKAGSDDIIDGTPSIANGKVTVVVKANNDEVAKTATLVVTCDGVTGIPELVINQDAKSNLVETDATIDFSKQGYSNQQQVSSLTQNPFTVTFTNGGTATAYYDTGSAVRVYNGGSMTISSEYTITKIEITGSAQKGADLSADGLSGTTWTGSSNSVTISVGSAGHYRFQRLTISYLAPASEVPVTPAITLSNLPTENISADGGVVIINYQIQNPVSGVTVSAAPASVDTWVNTFDYDTDGAISFVVDPKTTTGTRTTTITVSYTGAESKTFEITQDGATSGGGDTNLPTEFTWSATTNTSIENGSDTATDESGTTVSWAKGTSSSTKVALNTDGMRLYSGSTFTVANENKKISKIEFTIKVHVCPLKVVDDYYKV